jgi:hypothetical protein
MPRPKNKAELLYTSKINFRKLLQLVNSFTPLEQKAEFPKGTLNRNSKDVLAHLHHWHTLLLGWYNNAKEGKKPDMPAKGYTWKTLPEFNKQINIQYQSTSFNQALKLLNESYLEVQKLIEAHTEEELFEKKRYSWTGSTSIAAYIISATSSHYDWAYKFIRKATKPIKK